MKEIILNFNILYYFTDDKVIFNASDIIGDINLDIFNDLEYLIGDINLDIFNDLENLMIYNQLNILNL
jgi:hypothetical protein